MKKGILCIGLMLLCCNFYAQKKEAVVIETNYDMPSFDNPEAILIDKNNVDGKSSASMVHITNYSKYRTLEFEVFVHSPLSSSWESLGTQKVSGFDTDIKFGKKYPQLKAHRYFAVVPKSVKKDDLQYKMVKKNGDLNIYLFNLGVDIYAEPLPYHEKENAFVFNKNIMPGDANEDVILTNMTSNAVVSITVYGWDAKKFIWLKCFSIAAASGSKTKIDTENDKIKYTKFKYLAIVPANTKTYQYNFSEKHSDWYITVSETF